MSLEYYYSVRTRGADVQQQDALRDEINDYYNVQEFNGEAPDIHWGGEWGSIVQDLTELSTQHPGILFLVKQECKDWVDPTPQWYYFANGQSQSAGGYAISQPVSGRLGVYNLLTDSNTDRLVSGIIQISTEDGLLQVKPKLEGDVLTLSIVDERDTPLHTMQATIDWWMATHDK